MEVSVSPLFIIIDKKLNARYWNWPLYMGTTYNLTESPLFDGSATSLSSNGVYNASSPDEVVAGGVDVGRGTGGGPVYAGPFVNHTLHLGPFGFANVFTGGAPATWTELVTRPFSRDLSQSIGSLFNNQTVVDGVMASSWIGQFQSTMSTFSGAPNPHGGGHYVLGADGADFFASPNDPAFWVHHGMIDRMWTQWQAVDPATRTYALNGTTEIFDPPTAPLATLSTSQYWGYLGKSQATGSLMKVGYEPYCYEYV